MWAAQGFLPAQGCLAAQGFCAAHGFFLCDLCAERDFGAQGLQGLAARAAGAARAKLSRLAVSDAVSSFFELIGLSLIVWLNMEWLKDDGRCLWR